MNDKVRDYVKKTLKKEGEFWLSIAKEKTRQYPNEGLRQIIIRTIIQHFESKFPQLMEEFDNEIKKKRELAKNEFASDTNNDIRQLFAIPDGLSTRINQAFIQRGWCRFLSNEAQKEFKEMDWFMKEFPRFKVPLTY